MDFLKNNRNENYNPEVIWAKVFNFIDFVENLQMCSKTLMHFYLVTKAYFTF